MEFSLKELLSFVSIVLLLVMLSTCHTCGDWIIRYCNTINTIIYGYKIFRLDLHSIFGFNKSVLLRSFRK